MDGEIGRKIVKSLIKNVAFLLPLRNAQLQQTRTNEDYLRRGVGGGRGANFAKERRTSSILKKDSKPLIPSAMLSKKVEFNGFGVGRGESAFRALFSYEIQCTSLSNFYTLIRNVFTAQTCVHLLCVCFV